MNVKSSGESDNVARRMVLSSYHVIPTHDDFNECRLSFSGSRGPGLFGFKKFKSSSPVTKKVTSSSIITGYCTIQPSSDIRD